MSTRRIQRIFLNNLDRWFSNFIIETFRTDHLPESKIKVEFMGTTNSYEDELDERMPLYFKPKIIKFDFNPSYQSEIFKNDIIIYNLNDGDINELEYIIRGLKKINIETRKILIIISNIMTWGKTPVKYKNSEDDTGEIYNIPIDEDEEREKKILERKKKEQEEKERLEREEKERLEAEAAAKGKKKR